MVYCPPLVGGRDAGAGACVEMLGRVVTQVGLLQFFGVLAHVSGLVLGLTLLAWGNRYAVLLSKFTMSIQVYVYTFAQCQSA